MPKKSHHLTSDRKLRAALNTDIDGAPIWIVEFHISFDEVNCDVTPLQLAQIAYPTLPRGHSCIVRHVGTGMEWSVCLDRQEMIEVGRLKPPDGGGIEDEIEE